MLDLQVEVLNSDIVRNFLLLEITLTRAGASNLDLVVLVHRALDCITLRHNSEIHLLHELVPFTFRHQLYLMSHRTVD